MTQDKTSKSSQTQAAQEARQDRLAQALRENLRKRKTQSRSRKTPAPTEGTRQTEKE